MTVIARSADLSPCGRYRYRLTRAFGRGKGTVAFVLLNPSTADGAKDDPTLRRCMGFAERWGYSRLVVVNLFPFRATYPAEMLRAIDPLGGDADMWILDAAVDADLVICAWGALGKHRSRGDQVRALLSGIRSCVPHHLGLCENGQPRHPLYLAGNVEPQPWWPLQTAREMNELDHD